MFPVHANRKLRKGESTEEERKTATQHKGPVLPLVKAKPEIEFRKITDEERKFNAFHTLRRVSIQSFALSEVRAANMNSFHAD